MNTEKCLFCGSENIRWFRMGINQTNTSLTNNKLVMVNCISPKCLKHYAIETVENDCIVYEFKKILKGKIIRTN